METTPLMEITPLPELGKDDEQRLQRLDLDQIDRTTRERGFCILGKRRELMPSGNEAHLSGRPEEEARRDAAFVIALHKLLATRRLVFRSHPGLYGERVLVSYLEGTPDDDLACWHYIEEWAVHQQFQREIQSGWDWAQVRAEAETHGNCRLGRREDLLPVDADFFIDEQALIGASDRGVMMMDIIWLQTLGEIAEQHGLRVDIDRDPETREI